MLLGVDPGGRTTGWCVTDGDQPVAADVVDRGEEPMHEYAYGVASLVRSLAHDHDVGLVCVEGLVGVTPHVRDRPISPTGLLQASCVFGAVMALLTDGALDGPRCEVVRPGGHGSKPLLAYPSSLVGARETKGTGRMRHARSAYDVALAGRLQYRTGVRGDTL